MKISSRHFHRIAWLALGLACFVIVFGAFVRLSNAGLSCPDWPTCYGRATWPETAHEVNDHIASSIRPLETHKAWREQLHRILAGSLGVLVLALALLSAHKRKYGRILIITASILVASAIPLYIQQHYVTASVVAIIAECILFALFLRWSNNDLSRNSVLTLMVIIFQALLGMWTVTWLLKPIIVMSHLIGGLLTFSLLTWTAWRATNVPMVVSEANYLKKWLIGGLVFVGIQIALGGWVSSNYAALSCGYDFPKCVGQWLPPTNFSEGFVLWRGIGVDYEGGVLDGASRIAIQLTHRVMALIVFIYILNLAYQLFKIPSLRHSAFILLGIICAQLLLGILNVKLGLPLWIAVAHNAGAVILLFTLVTLIARLKIPEEV